jgi:hypothetical protein
MGTLFSDEYNSSKLFTIEADDEGGLRIVAVDEEHQRVIHITLGKEKRKRLGDAMRSL